MISSPEDSLPLALQSFTIPDLSYSWPAVSLVSPEGETRLWATLRFLKKVVVVSREGETNRNQNQLPQCQGSAQDLEGRQRE